MWKNIKNSYKNSKFKISAPKWNDKFELPGGSYSIIDIQDYFEYFIKKRNTLPGCTILTNNCPVKIYKKNWKQNYI